MTEAEVKEELFRLQGIDLVNGDVLINKVTRIPASVVIAGLWSVVIKYGEGEYTLCDRALFFDHYEKLTMTI